MGREEGHVTVEAEIRVKPPQAKEQRDHLKPEVGREEPPLEPSGGRAAPPAPWFQTSSLQSCERMTFYCFKSPSLCCFLCLLIKALWIKKEMIPKLNFMCVLVWVIAVLAVTLASFDWCHLEKLQLNVKTSEKHLGSASVAESDFTKTVCSHCSFILVTAETYWESGEP